MKHLTTTLLLLLATALAHASGVEKRTYTFAIHQGDTLRLDRYTDNSVAAPETGKPVILFAFGGGFSGGQRDESRYLPFFEFFAGQGYTVVSTDYRTALKGLKGQPAGLEQFATALGTAIHQACEDFLLATNFVVSHSADWNINPGEIVAAGSSAGAITALQTENFLCNPHPSIGALSADFNYAGVVSFAGAVMANGEPQWTKAPCPILLFHGDADANVPYDKLTVGNLGLYGSASIARQLTATATPHEFYTVRGADHGIAVSPMKDNLYDILAFLKNLVKDRRQWIVNTTRTVPGTPADYKTDFTITDFIQNNLP